MPREYAKGYVSIEGDDIVAKLKLTMARLDNVKPVMQGIANQFRFMESSRFADYGHSDYGTPTWQPVMDNTLETRSTQGQMYGFVANQSLQPLVSGGFLRAAAENPEVFMTSKKVIEFVIDPRKHGAPQGYSKGENYAVPHQLGETYGTTRHPVDLTQGFSTIALLVARNYFLPKGEKFPLPGRKRTPKIDRGEILRKQQIRDRAILSRTRKAQAEGKKLARQMQREEQRVREKVKFDTALEKANLRDPVNRRPQLLWQTREKESIAQYHVRINKGYPSVEHYNVEAKKLEEAMKSYPNLTSAHIQNGTAEFQQFEKHLKSYGLDQKTLKMHIDTIAAYHHWREATAHNAAANVNSSEFWGS
jgi:hypothetical protein